MGPRIATRSSGRAHLQIRGGAGGGPSSAGSRRVRLSRTRAQDETVREIKIFAEGLGQAHDHVLVLGIGGSALGTKALLNALRRPAWNEWDDEGREFFPRLTILENVDPTTVAAALRRIDPRRVLVNVISKSGGTAETMAQYLVVRGWLEEALGRRRTAIWCSPPILSEARCASWPPRKASRHCESRRGRRPVQRAFAGGPAPRGAGRHRHRGAARGRASRGRARRRSDDLLRNPAALYAALHWAAEPSSGARIHVLMPYTDRLREFAEWYRQLWAESLGKRVDRNGRAGAHRAHPGGRRRCNRPAQPGAALHGRTLRQGHHLRRGASLG